MKKYALLILLPVIFWGCEKTYDSVVNPKQTNSIKITGIASVDSINYDQDSVLIFAVSFNSSEEIESVYFNIVSPNGLKINSSPIMMYDDGNTVNHGDFVKNDNTFSNKFNMKYSYLDGVYIIQYYVVDIYNNTNYMSAQNFVFNNGQEKFAPVISNLDLPDSVTIGQLFSFSVMAVDSNGQNDIDQVYYELYKPDGSRVSNSQGVYQFPLFDDGQTSTDGDIKANDSTYTVLLTFPSGQPLGSWRFEFRAIDRSNLLSNKIIQHLKVIQ